RAPNLTVPGLVEAMAISGRTIRVPPPSMEDGQPLSVDIPAFSFQAPAAECSAVIATVPARKQRKVASGRRELIDENIARLEEAGNNGAPVIRGVRVEIAQAAEAVHQPFRVGRSPARINLELRHPRGVESCCCLRLHFRAAQRLAEFGHERRREIAW